MRYSQLKNTLFEDTKQTIVLQAYRDCQSTVKKFIKDHYEEFAHMTVPAAAFDNLKQLEKDIKHVVEFGKEYDNLSNKISNIKDDIYNYAYHANITETVKNQWIHSLLEQLEVVLEKTAYADVESKHGTVEKYNWDQESFDDIAKKNLYFLQHIIVHLDTEGTRYGKPVTGGGFFRDMVSRSYKEFELDRTKDIDFSNYLSSGIKIYTSKQAAWRMMCRQLLDQIQLNFYGEIISEPSNNETVEYFLKPILSTFVHEYVHLLQYVERNLSQRTYLRIIGRGMTHVPTPGAARGRRQRRTNAGYKWFRAGKRGAHDRLGGDTPPTDTQYENYFGTAHEIEAHAANTAADMVQEFLEEQERHTWRRTSEAEFQRNLNQFIDDAIINLKYRYAAEKGSLGSYYAYIKDRIEQVDYRIGEPLPKADILHRKVWRIYMTKLVKALEQYKKPVPKEPWED